MISIIESDVLKNEERHELEHILKNIFTHKCQNFFSRKYYNLFNKNIIFEPNTNDSDYADELYYLGIYYKYIKIYYSLMIKYLSMAIDKRHVSAMFQLGEYFIRDNKGSFITLDSFISYPNTKERIDSGKKYLLMAISCGCIYSARMLGNFYADVVENQFLNYEDAQDYLYAIVKGNIRFAETNVFDRINFNYYSYVFRSYDFDKHMINLFCSAITDTKTYSLNMKNFNFCVCKIINYINLYVWRSQSELKEIDDIMKHIAKLYYCYNKRKKEYREYIKCTLKSEGSQIFMEYLDLHHYRYLGKIYAAGKKGYFDAKKHFKSIIINKK